MTGSPAADGSGGAGTASQDADLRRRRARYRAWHRGIREMDLIMGAFADAEAARMSEADLSAFERLLELPDREVYGWITGEDDIPGEFDGALFRRLVDYQARRAGHA